MSSGANSIWPVTVRVLGCTVCGVGLEVGTVNCPVCESRPRTRTISAALDRLGVRRSELPLLAFAMTANEATVLRPRFPTVTSVSLCRVYGRDHQTGVDARDLSQYAPDTFGGHFGSLLFDYFEEHQAALQQAYRVIAPGGLMLTHIAGYRLDTDDNARPHADGTVLEERFPAVTVGRAWFLRAIGDAGFGPVWLQIVDASSGETIDWFAGIKPGPYPPSEQGRPLPRPGRRLFDRLDGESKTLSTRVDPAFGFEQVTLRWSIPPLPRGARFGGHQFDTHSGLAGMRVVTVGRGTLWISDDLGESWEEISVPAAENVELDNAHLMPDGGILAQARAPQPGDRDQEPARIFIFNKDLELETTVAPGLSQWHGSSGIDNRDGTIIYGEYSLNAKRPRPNERVPEAGGPWNDSHIYRSVDGGHTWETVHTAAWREIRHFHTVRADPSQPHVWYASTGDWPWECFVMRSTDDGRSWHDATGQPTDELTNKPYARAWQALYRLTDLAITDDYLIWGTDDFLGSPDRIDAANVAVADRVGSRLCVAAKGDWLHVTPIARVGNPVRSIVDLRAAWLVITQAKRLQLPRPQVVLMSKIEPFRCVEIATADLFGGPSSFTLSRSSRAAKGGRFFSFRGRCDVFRDGPGVLQWDVGFE